MGINPWQIKKKTPLGTHPVRGISQIAYFKWNLKFPLTSEGNPGHFSESQQGMAVSNCKKKKSEALLSQSEVYRFV